MRKILCFIISIVAIVAMVIPCSAQMYDHYTTYNIQFNNFVTEDLTRQMEDSYAIGIPTSTNLDVTYRVHLMVVNTENDRDLQAYMMNTVRPILLAYQRREISDLKKALDGILEFGNPEAQPNDYYKIHYEYSTSGIKRFAFKGKYSSFASDYDPIYKYQQTAYNEYVFDITFNVTKLAEFTPYLVNSSDVPMQMNNGHYWYPVVRMDAFYDQYTTNQTQLVYIQVESVNAHWNRPNILQENNGSVSSPHIVLVSNYDSMYLNCAWIDSRYTYYAEPSVNMVVTLENGKDDIPLRIPYFEEGNYISYGQNLEERNDPLYFAKEFYYSTQLNAQQLRYYVSDYQVIFDQYLADGSGEHFYFYMRTRVYSDEGILSVIPPDKYFNDCPISTSAYVLYTPKIMVGETANGTILVGGLNPDTLYQDTTVRYDDSGGLFQDLANFFLGLWNSILAVFNNAIVWLFMEAPLISKVTAPLFQFGYTASAIITKFMIPLLTSVGVFGVAFVIVLVIKLIKRLVS